MSWTSQSNPGLGHTQPPPPAPVAPPALPGGAVVLNGTPANGQAPIWNGQQWVPANTLTYTGSPATNQGLVWNGTGWVPAAIANSFNNRTGAITPQSGDYTASQVSALGLINASDITHGLKAQAGAETVSIPVVGASNPEIVTVTLPTAWQTAHVAFLASCAPATSWAGAEPCFAAVVNDSSGNVSIVNTSTAQNFAISWLSIGY